MRAIAMRLLVRLEGEPETRASELLAGALPGVGDPRDRALLTELVYGVLRWQRRLDHGLARWMPKGIGGVEATARAFLRLGAYQIRFLDRIPPEIAVSATQDAARSAGLGRMTGLLNAILRREVATPEALPEGESDRAIGIVASLPDWMVAELRRAFPRVVRAEALALRERASVTLRPTAARFIDAVDALDVALIEVLADEGFIAKPLVVSMGSTGSARLLGDGKLVEVVGTVGSASPGGQGSPGRDADGKKNTDIFQTRAFREGRFVAQDAASLAVVDQVEAAVGGVLEGKRILDLCAGRGVKATALADRGARVVAVDIAGKKLDELMRVARRLGVEGRIERTLALDAADAGDGPGSGARELAALGEFDAVLVDAPCTGLGTLRRHPEIAWRREPSATAELVALQGRLVSAAAARVKPGGGLVYAVCSFVRAEGEAALPSGFEVEERVAVAPSTGLDAFQGWRARRSS
ncbi:MAG: hypothetical protein JNJ59_22030 [Deltaproteobacteria bacterium]|nr:hypothetical protein [Deltaproteobacteria bacterium]